MNKNKSFYTFALLLAASIIFTSCRNNDDDNGNGTDVADVGDNGDEDDGSNDHRRIPGAYGVDNELPQAGNGENLFHHDRSAECDSEVHSDNGDNRQ